MRRKCTFHLGDVAQARGGREELRVNSGGESAQSLQQGRRGSVEELVTDAVNASLADGAQVGPAASFDNFLQRNAVASSAPGGNEDVGIEGANRFGLELLAGFGEGTASGSLNEFGNPRLGGDQGLAPFFTEDGGTRRLAGASADGFDLRLHVGDEEGGARGGADDCGDGGDVGVDIGEGAGSQSEEAGTGLEDFGYGFFLVGDGGDDEVRMSGGNLAGVGRPGVVQDEAAGGNIGADIRAVFCAGNEAVELVKSGENGGRARLEADNTLGQMVHLGGLFLSQYPRTGYRIRQRKWEAGRQELT